MVTPVGQGQVPILKFPGVFILIARATAENPVTGGTEGSTVGLIRFKVRDLKATLASLDAAGYKRLPDSTCEGVLLAGPHDARVQLIEDRSLTVPVMTDSLVMRVRNAAKAAEWYAQWFGATVTRRGQTTYAKIPGMDIQFEETKEPAISTRGRALDHIGFEVRNLQALMSKLAAGGVQPDRYLAPP